MLALVQAGSLVIDYDGAKKAPGQKTVDSANGGKDENDDKSAA
jgi:hypothetical protein